MAEPVEVRIRPHHHDGDVLVGHAAFPEGIPGIGDSGGATKMLDLWLQIEGGLSSDAQDALVPISEGGIMANSGFELAEGDTQFDVPSGAYLAKLHANIEYPSTPPTSGFATMHFDFYYLDDNGDEQQVPVVNIEVNTQHEIDGSGDYPFTNSPVRTKFDIALLPKDGYARVTAWSNADVSPMSISGELVLVKF